MPETAVKELTLEAFSRFGTYAAMIDPDWEKIGEEPIEFFRDMVPLDLGGVTSASFSVCRVRGRPQVVDVTEFHNGTGEGILPLDADVLIHVAPATAEADPPVDRIEVFRVPRGTLVVIRPGVWHHAPFVVDAKVANVLIVLPERTYAVDCTVRELGKRQQVRIRG